MLWTAQSSTRFAQLCPSLLLAYEAEPHVLGLAALLEVVGHGAELPLPGSGTH